MASAVFVCYLYLVERAFSSKSRACHSTYVCVWVSRVSRLALIPIRFRFAVAPVPVEWRQVIIESLFITIITSFARTGKHVIIIMYRRAVWRLCAYGVTRHSRVSHVETIAIWFNPLLSSLDVMKVVWFFFLELWFNCSALWAVMRATRGRRHAQQLIRRRRVT